jgi:hypothetical protein
VGIFHNNGQAGLPQNEELAMQYFHRAADHPHNPFPLAMNVVGKVRVLLRSRSHISRVLCPPVVRRQLLSPQR